MRTFSTILLVDDQEVRRSLLHFLLWVHNERESGSMNIVRVSSAVRALSVLKQAPDTFDSVLSLLHPIGSDAIGAWLKKNEPRVKLVTLEGYPRPDEIQHLLFILRQRIKRKTGPQIGWTKRLAA